MLALMCDLRGVIFFHLLVHSYFKAGAFMIAGSVMLARISAQDTGLIPSFIETSPSLGGIFAIFFFNLLALFFVTSYFSKEKMMIVLGAESKVTMFGDTIIIFSCLLRRWYSIRLAKCILGEKIFCPRINVCNNNHMKLWVGAGIIRITAILTLVGWGFRAFLVFYSRIKRPVVVNIYFSERLVIPSIVVFWVLGNQIKSLGGLLPQFFKKSLGFFYLSLGSNTISWLAIKGFSKNIFGSANLRWVDYS